MRGKKILGRQSRKLRGVYDLARMRDPKLSLNCLCGLGGLCTLRRKANRHARFSVVRRTGKSPGVYYRTSTAAPYSAQPVAASITASSALAFGNRRGCARPSSKAANDPTAITPLKGSHSNRLSTTPVQLHRPQESCLNLPRLEPWPKSVGIRRILFRSERKVMSRLGCEDGWGSAESIAGEACFPDHRITCARPAHWPSHCSHLGGTYGGQMVSEQKRGFSA